MHGEALRKAVDVEDQTGFTAQVAEDWRSADLPENERAMLEYVEKITFSASTMTQDDTVHMQELGWSDRDILDINPCIGVRAPGKETRRDRILSEAEIATFWRGLGKARMSDQVRLALKLQLVTAQRRGEIVEADWSEMDLGNRVWTIAAERSKNRVAHSVPLSQMALELIENIRPISGESAWLFPSPKGGDRPITRRAVNHALNASQDVLGVDNVTTHDLRRSAASHMTALGIPRLVVGKVLNHSDRSVTAIYDRHGYDREKRQALDVWGRRLEEIISGVPATDNVVVPLAAGREPA